MKYRIKQIQCRPWTLNGFSPKLIESHYENNYGGAMRRLNAISEQLAALDFADTPGHVLNGLKREELVALNSTLLHELYFASLGGDGQPTKGMSQVLAEHRLDVVLKLFPVAGLEVPGVHERADDRVDDRRDLGGVEAHGAERG